MAGGRQELFFIVFSLRTSSFWRQVKTEKQGVKQARQMLILLSQEGRIQIRAKIWGALYIRDTQENNTKAALPRDMVPKVATLLSYILYDML